MPRSMYGTGGTQRELFLDLAMDAYSKGHVTPLVGSFKPAAQIQMGSPHQEVTLMHRKAGRRLIICGDSTVGSDHVCGN